MGIVHSRRLLTNGLKILLPVALAFGCADVDSPDMGRDQRTLRAPRVRPAVDPDTLPPAVPNGEPMPPAELAAGIPPYPNATVYVRHPAPRSSHWFQAFTFDTWDQVAAFYEESLPGWKVTRQATVVVFEKEPDQAAITVSPWAYQDLPDDAPRVLREARTAIGAAWD